MSEKGYDEVAADFQAQQIGTHIAHKIYELNNIPNRNKAKKKNVNPVEPCNLVEIDRNDQNDRNVPENNTSSDDDVEIPIEIITVEQQDSLHEESLESNKNKDEKDIKLIEEDEEKESSSAMLDGTDSSQGGDESD